MRNFKVYASRLLILLFMQYAGSATAQSISGANLTASGHTGINASSVQLLSSKKFDITKDSEYLRVKKEVFGEETAELLTEKQIASFMIISHIDRLSPDAMAVLEKADLLNSRNNIKDMLDVLDLLANLYENDKTVVPLSNGYVDNDQAILAYAEQLMANLPNMKKDEAIKSVLQMLGLTKDALATDIPNIKDKQQQQYAQKGLDMISKLEATIDISFNNNILTIGYDDISDGAKMVLNRDMHNAIYALTQPGYIDDETSKALHAIPIAIAKEVYMALDAQISQSDTVKPTQK